MPPQQIEMLVQRQFTDADGAGLGRDCVGNPLLALELARAGVEGGSSLDELVYERVAGFDEATESLLQWAAVMSPRISLNSLERVSGLSPDAIDNALEQAEQQGIMHPGEHGFRFAHELIRQSVYQSISPSRQRAMHRRVAELLERDLSRADAMTMEARPWGAGFR